MVPILLECAGGAAAKVAVGAIASTHHADMTSYILQLSPRPTHSKIHNIPSNMLFSRLTACAMMIARPANQKTEIVNTGATSGVPIH